MKAARCRLEAVMSNGRRRGLLGAILALSLILIPLAIQGQEMRPSANILLPYFEIRLPDPNAASLEDTQMGLVNASSSETEVEFTIYTNWGIPVLSFNDVLRRTEPRAIDLQTWIIDGELPDRILSEAELAELHAALTGQPSPTDHLYRGIAVGTGIAAGYVIMRTLRPDLDVLWGDTFSLDPMIDYFQGETLATLDDNLEAECTRHAIRFSNRDELFESTELIIWTGRAFQPSPTTEPIGPKVQLVTSIYDESGNHVHDCVRELIAVQVLPVCQLENLPPIGWFDMKLDQKSFVQEHLHSVSSASAQLHAWCLPVELSLEGPGISIEKYVNHLDADNAPGAEVAIGDALQFDYHVKNTGMVPLQNIVVTDSEGLTVACPRTSLEPGEHMVCTAQSTALPCTHKNLGSVVAQTASGHEVKDRDPAWYTAHYDASITLEKKVNGEDADTQPGVELAEGAPVTFTFEVLNTGAVALAKIKVKDNAGIGVHCPEHTLEPGASMTCTAAPFAATVGQHDNEATVTGETPCDDEVSASDPAHYFVPSENRPAIDVEKLVNEFDADTPTGPIVDIESIVQFRYIVTNTGNVPLVDVEMVDEDYLTCTSATLAVGASFECGTSTYAAPGQHSNTANVHGHWGEQTVEDTDLGHYFGSESPVPGIDIEKFVNGLDADTEGDAVHVLIGSVVSFTYDVSNTGNVMLMEIDITDSTGIDVSCPKTVLVPGEKMTCTASAIADQGLHTNIGTVVGTAGQGDSATQVTDSDPGNYIGEPVTHPAIDIEKLVNQADADSEADAIHVQVGSTLQFTYVVTNTGDVALTNVAVTDNTGMTVTCPKTTLEPTESMTCTASASALLGLHTNVGTASGTPASGMPTPVTDTDPANYVGDPPPQPAIDIEKFVNQVDADTEAEAVYVLVESALLFTYVVTNTGDIALTNVTVTDNTGMAVTCPKTTLDPGESMTCTTSASALLGLHTNIGTATGTPEIADSAPATDTDPANYIGYIASIDLEKYVEGADADTTAEAVHVQVGAQVDFTFVVTNTGSVNLTGVAAADDTIPIVTCPKSTLAPGESMTCVAQTYALVGLHTNVGTAAGTPPVGSQVSDTDPANYYGEELGTQGCTPGYWKNHTGSWPPTGYATSQAVDTVFASVNPNFPSLGDATLLQALSFAGGPGTSGAAEILLRAGVAALLNAAHSGVSYPLTTADVISQVNTALASNNRDAMLVLAAQLDAYNNLGCPLH
jgi:uncharacterized repeat protein (TIGR01451 family)